MEKREIRGKSTDGPISRYFNRKISSRISRYIISHGYDITPNQFTMISTLTGILSLPFYLLSYPIVAGILVELSSILDGVDGEIARARNMMSRSGAFLDACLDRYTDFIILLGASLYLLSKVNSIIAYIAIISSIAGSILVSYIHSRGERDLNLHPAVTGRFPNIASRDIRLFIIFIGSMIDQLLYTLLFLATITNLYYIIKIFETFRLGREKESSR